MDSKLYQRENWNLMDPELIHFLYSSVEIKKLHPSKDLLLLENLARNGDGTRKKMAYRVLKIEEEPEIRGEYVRDGFYDEMYWLLREQVQRVEDIGLLKAAIWEAPDMKARFAFVRLTGYIFKTDEHSDYSYRDYRLDAAPMLPAGEIEAFCNEVIRKRIL